jgi:glutathione S-transferase
MTIKLHRFELSGHCHRVELLLSILEVPFVAIDVDLLQGQQKLDQFTALNPFGQVPVLDDDGVIVSDSNAILVYLACRYDRTERWLPKDPQRAAAVQRWLSVAAGPLAHGAAVSRAIAIFKRAADPESARVIARTLLGRMDRHLADRQFLADQQATIADLAMYTYTAHAPEGGVALAPYLHVVAWLRRVEVLSGFTPMKATETAELAGAQ